MVDPYKRSMERSPSIGSVGSSITVQKSVEHVGSASDLLEALQRSLLLTPAGPSRGSQAQEPSIRCSRCSSTERSSVELAPAATPSARRSLLFGAVPSGNELKPATLHEELASTPSGKPPAFHRGIRRGTASSDASTRYRGSVISIVGTFLDPSGGKPAAGVPARRTKPTLSSTSSTLPKVSLVTSSITSSDNSRLSPSPSIRSDWLHRSLDEEPDACGEEGDDAGIPDNWLSSSRLTSADDRKSSKGSPMTPGASNPSRPSTVKYGLKISEDTHPSSAVTPRRNSCISNINQWVEVASAHAGQRPSLCGSCCLHLQALRRKIAPHCRSFIKNKVFQVTMFLALIMALFLPDLWIVLDRPNNNDLDVILTGVLMLFLIELAMQSIGLTRTYWGSFFFWMDLLGAASLLIDLSYLSTNLTTSLGDSGSNVVILRVARIAKLAARAGRFTKLVKLLRFLPGMRQQAPDQNMARVISSRLITSLSMRVSCLNILMVMIMPMFSMWTYPEQDWSIQTWLVILEAAAVHQPEAFQEQLAQFGASYDDLGYYPYRLSAKAGAALPAAVLGSVPWHSPRGPPNRMANAVTHQSTSFVCDYSFKRPNQVDSLMNVALLLFVMVLMCLFSLMLTNFVSDQVLRPLEKLLKQVRKMVSTIFRSVTDMADVFQHDSIDENADGRGSESEGEEGEALGFGNETELLERVVRKLAVLSEIAMAKSMVDADAMEGLEEGDRAVISGIQKQAGMEAPEWRRGTIDEGGQGDYEAMRRAQEAMVESAALSLDLLNSNGLNPLELDRARNHAAATFFLAPHNHWVSFDSVTMRQFLEAAEEGYSKTCPYHNWFHAVDITHCVYRLLKLCAADTFLSPAARYGLLVSATCHDIGHPGLNNAFLTDTSHDLALRYNDKSPLENMHCARLFKLVSTPGYNIFGQVPKRQFQEVRQVCIEAILHTDNSQHFPMIKACQMFYEVNSQVLDLMHTQDEGGGYKDFRPTKEAIDCYRQPDNQKLVVKLVLHYADVSNPMKPFRICRIWAWKITEEFFSQGDQEKLLGAPVQALNDREKVNRPFSQIGFIEFLLSPLVLVVMKVLPPTELWAGQMLQNLVMWQQTWVQETKPKPSVAEQKAVSERVAKLQNKFWAQQQ